MDRPKFQYCVQATVQTLRDDGEFESDPIGAPYFEIIIRNTGTDAFQVRNLISGTKATGYTLARGEERRYFSGDMFPRYDHFAIEFDKVASDLICEIETLQLVPINGQ